MSVSFQGILWNRQKRIYDLVLWSMMAGYLVLFVVLNLRFNPRITPETMIIRGLGTLALFMLHVILSIGPLSRIDKRFLILLYNRRHFGVSMFLVAAAHGLFSLIQFHGLGNVSPLVSLLASNLHYTSFIYFPFQVLGMMALVILFLMAATSHDFWLAVLSPRVWKTLHTMVYVAYGLLIFHVALGVLQLEHAPVMFMVLMTGLAWITGLHLYSGLKENQADRRNLETLQGWVKVGAVSEIPDYRARVIHAGGERIAIFRYDGKLSAVNNVCKHQMGPLGEGRIVEGCITCPWHGYQYRPEDGCSPPPFKEQVATYDLKVEDGIVYVNPQAHREGTPVMPVKI